MIGCWLTVGEIPADEERRRTLSQQLSTRAAAARAHGSRPIFFVDDDSISGRRHRPAAVVVGPLKSDRPQLSRTCSGRRQMESSNSNQSCPIKRNLQLYKQAFFFLHWLGRPFSRFSFNFSLSGGHHAGNRKERKCHKYFQTKIWPKPRT